MRLPNGYGSVKKLSGNRRKPYGAFITVYYAWDDKEEKAKQVQKAIGYFATRKEALQKLAEYNDNPYDLESQRLTFKEVWEKMQTTEFANKSKSVMKSLTTSYNKCSNLYDLPFIDLNAKHLEVVIEKEEGKSISTQQNILKLFRAMYNYALRYDIAKKNYAELLVLGKYNPDKIEKRPFTREEIKKTWENMDWVNNPNGNIAESSHLVDSVLFLLYTGMRLKEFLDLTTDNVHGTYIDLMGTKTPSARRLVPIHSKIAPIVQKRLQNGNKYLFTYDNGGKISETQYRNNFFKPFTEYIGKPHIPHETRHSFISFSETTDMNKYALAKIVGHKVGTITGDVYGHITADNIDILNREIEKLMY